MRVLLASPFPGPERFVSSGRCQILADAALGTWPPVDLAQIAATVSPFASEVRIVDLAVSPMGRDEAVRKISLFRPDLVIAHSTTPTLSGDISVFGRLKDACGARVAFYGLHATARPRDILSDDIPLVIRREPEETAAELAAALAGGKPVDKVTGISRWEGGRVVDNPDREFIASLDSLPLPDLGMLDNGKYRFGYFDEPFTIIHVSRGCPFDCSFCTCRMYYGGRWRCRSPRAIADEMERDYRVFGLRNFLLLSDTFNCDPGFVHALCAAISGKRLPVRWMCNSRSDRFDEDTARRMRKAGCFLVSFGVESSSDGILARCGKGETTAQSAAAVAAAARAGLRTVCYFIFGLPGETRQTAAGTAAFAKKIGCDYAYFYVATPFPGTRFFEEAEREGWMDGKGWDEFVHGEPVISLPAFPRKALEDAVRRAHRSFYLDPARIGRELFRVVAERRFGALGTGLSFLGSIAKSGRRDGRAHRNRAG